MSKTMVLKVPEGNSVLRVNLKSKTEKFFPKVYFNYLEDLDDKLQDMQFPPGASNFNQFFWDYSLGIINYQVDLKNVKSKKAGVVIHLFDNSDVREK